MHGNENYDVSDFVSTFLSLFAQARMQTPFSPNEESGYLLFCT